MTTINTEQSNSVRLLTDSDIRTSYWMFEIYAQACCSYERLQAPGFFMGMKNVIHKLYDGNQEEMI